jgi:hypothetical protein
MMNHRRSLTQPLLRLCICAFLLVPTARADNEHAPSSTYNEEAYQQGRADALRDLAKGVLAYETFGLPKPDFSEYQQVLLERYKIELRPIAGCVVDSRILGHSYGYNQIMGPEIERRYGDRVWDQAEAEAEQRLQQKQASK